MTDKIKLSSPFFIALIPTALSFLINGYSFSGVQADQDIYIPMVKSLMNPVLSQNDYMLSTIKEMHSFFFVILAFLGKLISLEAAYLVLHALCLYISSIFIYLLALELSQSRPAALISLALLIEPKTGLTWNR